MKVKWIAYCWCVYVWIWMCALLFWNFGCHIEEHREREGEGRWEVLSAKKMRTTRTTQEKGQKEPVREVWRGQKDGWNVCVCESTKAQLWLLPLLFLLLMMKKNDICLIELHIWAWIMRIIQHKHFHSNASQHSSWKDALSLCLSHSLSVGPAQTHTYTHIFRAVLWVSISMQTCVYVCVCFRWR